MTGLNSWLSPAVLHALGWALIHSLWQCAGVAALAMLVMAFIRRPAVRYVIGVGALALMLAAPVATFFVLMKPVAPVQALPSVTASVLPASPAPSTSYSVAALATADRAIGAIAEAPRRLPLPDMLPWLVAAWACGVAFFSMRFAGGFLLLEHRRRTRSHMPGEHVLALCHELQRRLGLVRAIQYLECGWVQAPAVIGWLRPAVLLPVFALTGLSEEQFKAVIAHELAHIRRHDWLVNLFQVLAESLQFYHPAMWWLNRRIRIERELCCDEIAVSLTGSRLEYARALAQMAEWKNVSLLAMAANRGPLTQRILHILGRKPAGAGQRVAGLTGGALFLCAALAAANLLFGIAYPVQMAQAKGSMKTALVSSQDAVGRMARQVLRVPEPPKIATTNETLAGDKSEADSGKLATPSSDLSGLLPNQTLATPTVTASNGPPAAPVQSTPNTSAAVALDDQAGMQPATGGLPAGPVQKALSAPPATPPDFNPNEPYAETTCRDVPHGTVTGRVTSSTTIQMPGFSCVNNLGGDTRYYKGGIYCFSWVCPCPNHATSDPVFGRVCPPLLTMTVQLANPADASKMPLGKLVTVKGDFLVITQNKISYLLVQNARVLYADPFNRQAASNEPPKVVHCSNTSVFGRVLSLEAVQLQGFNCKRSPGGPTASVSPNSNPGISFSSELWFGSCPNESTDTGEPAMTSRLGRAAHPCAFDVQMNVQFADLADAAKMQPGKMVRLAGDFQVTKRNGTDYLTVTNAKIIWTDPFDRHAAAHHPAPPAAPNSEPAAFTPHTVQTPAVFASNALPTSPNATRETVTACHNSSVFGRVVSSKAITMQGFTCFKGQPGSKAGPQDVALGDCPLASTTDAHKAGCKWDVTLNVRLADPDDADKMRAGQLVRLAGDFALINRDQKQYLAVQNARILFRDVFYGRGGGDIGPFYSGGSFPSGQPGFNAGGGDPGIGANTPPVYGEGTPHGL